MYISLLLPSARHIKEVVDANPLKLMSAIFNRPGQCTYAATCAHSETPLPSLLFCRENSFTPSIHPALLMVEMEWVFIGCICCPPGCVPLQPPFLPLGQTPGHPLNRRPCHSNTLLLPSVPPMILQSGWALQE